jgi:hypothetical protein
VTQAIPLIRLTWPGPPGASVPSRHQRRSRGHLVQLERRHRDGQSHWQSDTVTVTVTPAARARPGPGPGSESRSPTVTVTAGRCPAAGSGPLAPRPARRSEYSSLRNRSRRSRCRGPLRRRRLRPAALREMLVSGIVLVLIVQSAEFTPQARNSATNKGIPDIYCMNKPTLHQIGRTRTSSKLKQLRVSSFERLRGGLENAMSSSRSNRQQLRKKKRMYWNSMHSRQNTAGNQTLPLHENLGVFHVTNHSSGSVRSQVQNINAYY